jgi:uncharacterized protein
MSTLGFPRLLVVQPTPFCNIACKYCYLPARGERHRMSDEVLAAVFRRAIVDSDTAHRLTIVWHLGEPLTVPLDFYRSAFDLSLQLNSQRSAPLTVQHSFQTNGTLLSEEWCALIREYGVHVGLSVDGPSTVHDRWRVTRAGRGTHAAVLRAMGLLQTYAIDYDVIAVITSHSLDHARDLFDFFVDNKVRRIGFNIEEVSGVNRTSSLSANDATARYTTFLETFVTLNESAGFPLRIREFDRARAAILTPGVSFRSSLLEPLSIISVAWNGDFSTFCPELLSTGDGRFVVGNVLKCSFEAALGSPVFGSMWTSIAAGVEKCRASCDYFGVCQGGAPSNKWFELGTFDASETRFCRLSRQVPLDVTLSALERQYFENV